MKKNEETTSRKISSSREKTIQSLFLTEFKFPENIEDREKKIKMLINSGQH